MLTPGSGPTEVSLRGSDEMVITQAAKENRDCSNDSVSGSLPGSSPPLMEIKTRKGPPEHIWNFIAGDLFAGESVCSEENSSFPGRNISVA